MRTPSINIIKKTILSLALLNFLLVAMTSSLSAQVKFTASLSSTSVPQNTNFQLTFNISGGKVESFSPPAFTGLTMIGSSHSSGGGMTMYMNGQKIETGGGETYAYTLFGANTGKFTLGPAKAKINGQWVTSNSVTVEITKGSPKQNQNKNQAQGNQGATQNKSGKISADDLFIKAYMDKSNPVQGEQVTVTYKLYTRIPVTQYAINKLSAFTGFWTQDLNKDAGNPVQYTETVNGIKYTVAEIRKVALFPQKSGRLTVEPLEVECIAQMRVQGGNPFGDLFDDPFFQNAFSSIQNVKQTLKSNSLAVNVTPLPEDNKPEQFAGAVGNFTFSAETDRNRVKQNEALTLKLTVRGTGNLSLVELPKPEFPSDFEVYDPQINEDITKNSNPVSGSKTFEYLIIPRTAGDFKLPALTFSYYDPKIRSYKSITVPEMKIQVEKGSGNAGGSGVAQSGVEMIGNDVKYANIDVLPLTPLGYQFFNSWRFYLILMIPVMLFAAFLMRWRRNIRLSNDTALMKNLRATRIAKKRLQLAEQHLQAMNQEAFFAEVSRALWGYVSDKFSLSLSVLSLDTVKDTLSEKQASEGVCDKLIATLNQCEFARFAPPGSTPDMKQTYGDATDVIVELEKELQQKKNRK